MIIQNYNIIIVKLKVKHLNVPNLIVTRFIFKISKTQTFGKIYKKYTKQNFTYM